MIKENDGRMSLEEYCKRLCPDAVMSVSREAIQEWTVNTVWPRVVEDIEAKFPGIWQEDEGTEA